jgi:hypothetical protein
LNWARVARKLFEETQGRISPLELAQMTIDQVIVIWADKEHLGGPMRLSPEEAASRGLISRPKTGKSAAQLIRERQKREKQERDKADGKSATGNRKTGRGRHESRRTKRGRRIR